VLEELSTAIHHERFAIPNRDGYPLRGDVRVRRQPGATPAAAIVVCHGFKGFKDWGFFPDLAQEVALAGYLAVSFNFSGSGIGPDLEQFTDVERFERATVSGDLSDLEVMVEAIANGRLPGAKPCSTFGLLGHSRGGGVALLAAAAEPRVRAVATWASVSHFSRWSPEMMAEWRARGHVEVENARTKQVFRLTTDLLADIEAHGKEKLSIERAVHDLRARRVPMLIVHGDGDESVQVSEGRDISGWGGGELRVLPGASHTFGAVHPFRGRTPDLAAAMAQTLEFFRRHLPPDGVDHR
jgi:uncharacterized protein